MNICLKRPHRYGDDEDNLCDGVPHSEFDGDTICEYRARCMELHDRYELPKNFAYSKSLPSIRPKVLIKGWWWKRFITKYRKWQKFLDMRGIVILNDANRMLVEEGYKRLIDYEKMQVQIIDIYDAPPLRPGFCECKLCEKQRFLEMVKNSMSLFGPESINYKHPKFKKYAKWLDKNK